MTIVCVSACGGPPAEFADWALEVPEGTAVHEYAAVPLAERDEAIRLEEDLVLGSDVAGDPANFYQVLGVVPDHDGNIYVLDFGNRRIQVFDDRGGFRFSLGGEGQGPGELPVPRFPAVSDDRVVVLADPRRLNVYDLAGNHIEDVRFDETVDWWVGIGAGFGARKREWLGEIVMEALPTRRYTFARYSSGGVEEEVFVTVDQPPLPELRFIGTRSGFFAGVTLERGGVIPIFEPRHAGSRDGTLYVTTSEEYQVQAYGSRRWALRVAWPREPIGEADVAAATARVPEELKGATASDLGIPERFRAISGLAVDGHGHVYVFPFHRPFDAPVEPGTERPTGDRPVDVFSADGEHLFSGMIGIAGWDGALEDHVYSARLDEETEEYEVVRHRLVEPFR